MGLKSIKIFSLLIYAILIFVSLEACNNKNTSNPYYFKVLNDRYKRDSFMRLSSSSPIAAREQKNFYKINYFKPDSNYRIKAKVVSVLKDTVLLKDKYEKNWEMIHWADFVFTFSNIEYKLSGFLSPQYNLSARDTISLYVPFSDLNAGNVCYRRGRYIEVTLNKNEYPDSLFLDFNYAFNPECAYNEMIASPLAPKSNFLKFKVNAGEKIFI